MYSSKKKYLIFLMLMIYSLLLVGCSKSNDTADSDQNIEVSILKWAPNEIKLSELPAKLRNGNLAVWAKTINGVPKGTFASINGERALSFARGDNGIISFEIQPAFISKVGEYTIKLELPNGKKVDVGTLSVR